MNRFIAFTATVVVLSCLSSAAADEQTYEFKQNYRAGQEFNVLFSQSTQIKGKYYAQGQCVDTFQSVDADQEKGKLTILQTADGEPTAETIALDPACGRFTQQSGEKPKQTNTRFAGKSITVRRDPTGAILCEVDGQQDFKLGQELRGWLDRDSSLYPDHPVRIKEKWDLSKKLAEKLHIGKDQQLLAFCQLKSVRTLKGRQFAELAISSAGMWSMERNGMVIHIETQMEGTAWVDLATGRVAKADLAGDVHASGGGDRGAVHVSAVGEGRMEYHQLCVAAKHRADDAFASGK